MFSSGAIGFAAFMVLVLISWNAPALAIAPGVKMRGEQFEKLRAREPLCLMGRFSAPEITVTGRCSDSFEWYHSSLRLMNVLL